MIATGFTQGPAYLAVDFFFMLSGFIIARTYEHRFGSGLGTGRFMFARLRRLWPVMALGGLIGIPVLAGKLDQSLAYVVALNMLLIPTPIGNAVFPLNGPAWSIFFELVANLVHGLILQRMSDRVLAAWIVLLLAPMVWIAANYGMDVGAQPTTFLFGLPRVLLPYSIGVLIWRRWGDVAPIRLSLTFTFAAMPVLFFGIAMLGLHSWVFELLFVLALCPLLIAGGLQVRGPLPWAVALGAVSFPLYALHLPILELASFAGAGMVAGCVLSLAAAALVAFGPPAILRKVSPGRLHEA